jgi:subtilisin-like proprotein convertase family protein
MKNLFLLLILISFVACNKKNGSVTSAGTVFPTPPPGPDPLAKYQWHLSNISNPYINGTTAVSGKNINLGTVQDSYTGDGVYVVVSDGRIDMDHPELVDNADLSLSKNYNSAYPYSGSPTTNNAADGHGTGTSSLILATKGNGLGGYGVAPDATLVGTNFIASSQSSGILNDQATLTGHAGVFNYSYGYANCAVQSYSSGTYPTTLRNGVIEKGHIYVTAAGNDYVDTLDSCGGNPSSIFLGNANLDQIKTYPSMIVVGATNYQGVHTNYSTPGSNVWVSAPGGDTGMGILVADLVGCSSGFNSYSALPFDNTSTESNPYCEFFSGATGTSYASPITAGAIAILKEIDPTLDWRDVKHILARTATKIDATAGNTNHPYSHNLAGYIYQQGWVNNSASYPFHPWYGFGQVNLTAAKALAEAPDFDLHELKSTDTFDDTPSYSSGTISLAIPDNSATGVSSNINVTGHNLFIEHVQVMVNVTHAYPGDLGIELTSPSGTTTKLLNIVSNMEGPHLSSALFGANAFYGERSSGAWTIKVVDGDSVDVGTLTNWKISIIGNKGEALADVTPPSPASAFTKSGTNLNWTSSPSLDVARYEICLALTSQLGTSCGDGDWRHVRGATTLALTGRIYKGQRGTFASGNNYTAKIRAIDTSENESTEVSTSWTQP